MKKHIIEYPLFRTVVAVLSGTLILILSSVLLVVIAKNTNLFDSIPILKKSFSHTSMLFLSIIFIFILNKGRLKDFGASWNLHFPIIKVALISISLGLLSSIISKLLPGRPDVVPANYFSFPEKILYIWFWASICEEVLTRGLIQGYLSPLKHIGITLLKYRLSLPVITGAIFFGAMHLALLSMGIKFTSVTIIVIFGTILGLIAGYQKEKTNSLIPAIIVHFCFNVGVSFLTLLEVLTGYVFT